MFAKKFSTISIATLAALGALALSVDGASARQGGGGGGGMRGGGMRGGGFHAAAFHGGGMMRRGGGFRQVGWGHRRHGYGWGLYGAPLLVGAGAYAYDCYYVRRYGALYKVCE
jgi:hypothetical protein